MTNNASFEGMQNILGNLRIASGTSTGVGAVVAGTLDYTGGDLSGTWTVQGGSVLKYRTAGTQRLNGTALTNEGTVEWDGGNMSFGNGSVLTNKSVVDAKTDHVMNYFGGSNGSFINKGTLRKSGGAGETRIDTIVFSNEGILEDVYKRQGRRCRT